MHVARREPPSLPVPGNGGAAVVRRPAYAVLMGLQRTAGNRAVSDLLPARSGDCVAQRQITVGTPHNRFFTPDQSLEMVRQFLTVLNQISPATTFTVEGGVLRAAARVGQIPTEFDTQMRAAALTAVQIPLILVRSTSRASGTRVDVDSFNDAYVDLGDLQSESPDSARMNLLHLIAERFAVPDYRRRVGTPELDDDAVFRPAHARGLAAERAYLRDRLHDPTIGPGTELRGSPLRFRFASARGYVVVHTLPTRGGGNTMTGMLQVIEHGGRPRSIEDWLAARPVAPP